jgi:hypothetical protein
MRNSTPLPGANHLAGLDIAFEHQTRFGRADAQAAIARLRLAQLGARHLDPRHRRIARRTAAIDIGLGDEAAAHQLQRALQLVLRQHGIGLADLDLRRERARLLGLDILVDDRQHLAGLHPVTRLHQHAQDLTAFAGNADRHLASGRQRASRVDDALDRARAGNDHGDGRGLRIGFAGPRLGSLARDGLRLAAEEIHACSDEQRQRDDGGDDGVAPTRTGFDIPFGTVQILAARGDRVPAKAAFVIHCPIRPNLFALSPDAAWPVPTQRARPAISDGTCPPQTRRRRGDVMELCYPIKSPRASHIAAPHAASLERVRGCGNYSGLMHAAKRRRTQGSAPFINLNFHAIMA